METITDVDLRFIGACYSQRMLFNKEWPDGFTITEENVVRALQLLDVIWFMQRILSSTEFLAYASYIQNCRGDYILNLNTLVMKAENHSEEETMYIAVLSLDNFRIGTFARILIDDKISADKILETYFKNQAQVIVKILDNI